MNNTHYEILETARKLFAAKGFSNVTMNDIAEASNKGRRTLYMYFKSKEDIYWNLIESEANHFLDTLEFVAHQNLPPAKKLFKFIITRMEAMLIIVNRNGTIKAHFFNDAQKITKVRVRIDQKEHQIIKNILDEGVKEGDFEIDNTNIIATVMQNSLKGTEVPYNRKRSRNELVRQQESIFNFIYKGISPLNKKE